MGCEDLNPRWCYPKPDTVIGVIFANITATRPHVKGNLPVGNPLAPPAFVA
jgi:hypothetical protein